MVQTANGRAAPPTPAETPPAGHPAATPPAGRLQSQQPAGTGADDSGPRRRRHGLLRHRVERALGNILTNNYDPGLLKGWGVRPSDWNFSTAIQQQVLRRLSVEVSFNRRSFRGFTVQDNTLAAPSDYTPYSIVAPQDPRLPGGGGYTIDGLFDVVPSLAEILNTVIDSLNYGDTSQVYNGVDVTVNPRARAPYVPGRHSTGTDESVLDVRANLPSFVRNIGAGLQTSADQHDEPLCRTSSGTLTPFRSLALVRHSESKVQVSGVFQSSPVRRSSPNSGVQPSYLGFRSAAPLRACPT